MVFIVTCAYCFISVTFESLKQYLYSICQFYLNFFRLKIFIARDTTQLFIVSLAIITNSAVYTKTKCYANAYADQQGSTFIHM